MVWKEPKPPPLSRLPFPSIRHLFSLPPIKKQLKQKRTEKKRKILPWKKNVTKMSRLISTSFDTLCIDCNTISHWTPADGWEKLGEKTLLGFVKETKEMTSRANRNIKGLYWPGVCETRRKRSPGESGRCPPCLSTFSYDSHWRALTPPLLSGFIWKKRKKKTAASQPAAGM
jgi:hypothetical protein